MDFLADPKVYKRVGYTERGSSFRSNKNTRNSRNRQVTPTLRSGFFLHLRFTHPAKWRGSRPLAISNCRRADLSPNQQREIPRVGTPRRRAASNVTESRAGARAYARRVSLDYDFHSSAQEKEIRLSPVVGASGVTRRRSGSTTFPARASMSLFTKHLLTAIACLLKPRLHRYPRTISSHASTLSLDELREISINSWIIIDGYADECASGDETSLSPSRSVSLSKETC